MTFAADVRSGIRALHLPDAVDRRDHHAGLVRP